MSGLHKLTPSYAPVGIPKAHLARARLTTFMRSGSESLEVLLTEVSALEDRVA